MSKSKIKLSGNLTVLVKLGTGEIAIQSSLPNAKKDMVRVTLSETEKNTIGENPDDQTISKEGVKVVNEYTNVKSIDAHIAVLQHAKKILILNYAERQLSEAQQRVEDFLRGE